MTDDTRVAGRPKPPIWDLPRTRLYLVRHGQVEGHDERRYNGQTDVDLTDLGRRQYQRLSERLIEAGVDVDAVYSSDLVRSVYGGRVLAEALGREFEILPAFRELHFGDWEGLTYDQIREGYPDEFARRFTDLANHRPPGGESFAQLIDRVSQGLAGLLEAHRHGSFLVVAHSGVNRVIICRALGVGIESVFGFDQAYGCLNIIDYYDDGRAVVRLLSGVNWDNSDW